MAIDKERSKQIRRAATDARILNKASRLRAQWTASGNCLHHDWHTLAQSVGLSSADIDGLQKWVSDQGLRPPRRPRATGTGLG